MVVCDEAQKAAVKAVAPDVAEIQKRGELRWVFQENQDNKVTNGAQVVV